MTCACSFPFPALMNPSMSGFISTFSSAASRRHETDGCGVEISRRESPGGSRRYKTFSRRRRRRWKFSWSVCPCWVTAINFILPLNLKFKCESKCSKDSRKTEYLIRYLLNKSNLNTHKPNVNKLNITNISFQFKIDWIVCDRPNIAVTYSLARLFGQSLGLRVRGINMGALVQLW